MPQYELFTFKFKTSWQNTCSKKKKKKKRKENNNLLKEMYINKMTATQM